MVSASVCHIVFDSLVPEAEVAGRFAGGKWICGVDVLRSRKCLAYSYGVNKDLSFELELIQRTGCEVRHRLRP
jgi:hypothetical protein